MAKTITVCPLPHGQGLESGVAVLSLVEEVGLEGGEGSSSDEGSHLCALFQLLDPASGCINPPLTHTRLLSILRLKNLKSFRYVNSFQIKSLRAYL